MKCYGLPDSQETEEEYPLLEENASPQGAEWLWSAITIRMYLSLIAVSANQHTKEASIGALQNLTACPGEVWPENESHYIYIHAFARHFYPKLLVFLLDVPGHRTLHHAKRGRPSSREKDAARRKNGRNKNMCVTSKKRVPLQRTAQIHW